MSEQGMLIVISGFSGAGKGTIIKKLIEKYQYSLSISATTRQPREGELDGREYYFRTRDEFESLIKENGFIEWAQYVNNYYGTPKSFVEQEMGKGHHVILEIEVQGALNIKKQYPEAVLIFITTKTPEILKERLIGRGTEDLDTVQKRLERASEEAQSMTDYDYLVVNDTVGQCAAQVHAIVTSQNLKVANHMPMIEEMIEKLNALS